MIRLVRGSWRTAGILIVLLCAFASAMPWDGSRAAPRRDKFALVVNVSDYRGAPLPNTAFDGRVVGDALRAIGFDVTALPDPTAKDLAEAVRNLARTTRGAAAPTILFYFAGHAEERDGANYLYLKPAEPGPAGGGSRAAGELGAAWILEQLSAAKSAKLVFILDACRTPADRMSARPGRGLAKMTPPSGGADVMILFSTQPGRPAYDGRKTGPGPFSRALGSALSVPGYSTPQIFSAVSDRVRLDTDEQQKPYFEGSLNYILNPRRDASKAEDEPLADLDRFASADQLVDHVLSTRSVDELKRLAESGSGLAHYVVGLAYWDGKGVGKDMAMAVRHLKSATALGYRRAAVALGYYYCCAEGGPKMRGEGIDWFEIADRLGDPAAAHNLGRAFEKGDGVEQDIDKALAYYDRAGKAGMAASWARAGMIFFMKRYGRVNYPRALEYFERSYSAGYTKAALGLGLVYRAAESSPSGREEPERALEYYVAGGEAGCGECWYFAGLLKENTDLAAAFSLYQRGAQAGDPDAMVAAAEALNQGRGTAEDQAAAYGYWKQAADAGSRKARAELAYRLARGRGVARDIVAAAPLIREALADDRSSDPQVRFAVYPPRVWFLADALAAAIESGQVAPAEPAEAQELRRRYGPKGAGLLRITFPVKCAGQSRSYDFFVADWDPPGEEETLVDRQARWLAQERACEAPQDVLVKLRQLKVRAATERVSFISLVKGIIGRPLDPVPPGH